MRGVSVSKFNERELRSLLCGALIGTGSARKVYHCRMNDRYVVKIEQKAGSFQNVAEWEIWSFADGGKLAKWFAPCQYISGAGSIMIQRKVQPLRDHELPKNMPAFMVDLKIENFGLLDGKFVCADYGTGIAGLRTVSTRMIKAKWR